MKNKENCNVVCRTPQQRVIYIHKETDRFITHEQWAEVMKDRESWVSQLTFTLYLHKQLMPVEFPVDPKELKNVTSCIEVNVEEIPYHPDWEMRVLSDLDENVLNYVIDNLRDWDALIVATREHFIQELIKVRDLKYRYQEINLTLR